MTNFDYLEFSKEIKERLRDKNALLRELSQEKTAQEILEFSNEIMLKLQQTAYALLEESTADAADAFLFLVSLNPNEYASWIGLGVSLQGNGNFELAIHAYEIASYCSAENPIPYFYLGKCLFAMYERENALAAFQSAIDCCENNETEFSSLKEEALEAKKHLIELLYPT